MLSWQVPEQYQSAFIEVLKLAIIWMNVCHVKTYTLKQVEKSKDLFTHYQNLQLKYTQMIW